MFSAVIRSIFYAGVSLNILTLTTFMMGFLMICVYFSRMRKTGSVEDGEQLVEQLLEQFEPQPLVDADGDVLIKQPNVITGKIGTRITINETNCINFGSDNFYNLVENRKITEEAIATIRKYGVGSCGPRGFYGTVDVHLDLEQRISAFMNMEEAVVYSYWFSTVASAIPAYCKRNDVIFCDEMISFAARKGMDAAKSDVVYFNHNDPNDLQKKIKAYSKNSGRKSYEPRKFLLLEGIYYNTGNICNLRPILKLREKYKMRLFLDESLSIGVLGRTGRGITEHFGIDLAHVDMIIGSLEGIAGSVGGFCVGSHFIIEHQRLSGLGYCFSASLPPVLTRAAYCAFDYLDENSPNICIQLQSQCRTIHTKLQGKTYIQVYGNERSPVKYLRLVDIKGQVCNDSEMYNNFVQLCQKEGVALVAIQNTSNNQWQIKLSVNIDLTLRDINQGIAVITRAALECMR